MRKLKLILSGAALTLALPVAATDAPKPHYLLTIALKDGDSVIGTPRLEVNSGEASRTTIGRTNGPSYDLIVTATPDPRGIAIATQLTLTGTDGVEHGYAPALLLAPGRRGAIEVNSVLDSRRTVRVELQVDPLT